MIFSLNLPRVGAQMQQGTIHKVLAKAGDELRPGTPILEVRVDLGAAKAQDCPPLFFFRMIATEKAHLRKLDVSLGAVLTVGDALGIASSNGAEDVSGAPSRSLRTTAVAIQVDPLSR